MLTKSLQNHAGVYERILTTINGQLVRVRFAVVEVGGAMRGRVISIVPIVAVRGVVAATSTATVQVTAKKITPKPDRSFQLCLPGSVGRNISDSAKPAFAEAIISPYVSFEFFMSQPTRAPSA